MLILIHPATRYDYTYGYGYDYGCSYLMLTLTFDLTLNLTLGLNPPGHARSVTKSLNEWLSGLVNDLRFGISVMGVAPPSSRLA
ncbi:hypothetical protein NEUTE2DRAFT_67244 [Neurospora tetrasperma FGSC 2509]|nr:hypothetical protein NEUTE2DRAFT_67244 [Neurospora tetrasperma FGSC 2509]